MIVLNVRHPRDFRGDLAAMIGSARVGERRLRELMTEFGSETTHAGVEAVLDGAERRVRAIIAEVGGGDRPELLVFNKADLSPDADRLAEASPGAVAVSAATGLGIDALVEAIGDRLRSQRPVVELHIPWARGDVIASVHAHGEVLSEVSGPDQMVMRTRLREEQRGRFAEFEPAAPVEPR